ncbi:MAG: hypothetical protein K0R39_339 [Symbiobacteriaceae bacterium]|nr:hypothetical protein [Symbiobacteriaceae bacterium]
MRKADDQDLRDALSEEVELLEPSDELWNKIYNRSVVQQEKRRKPWLTGALAMGAAAAVAAIFLFNGQMGPAPRSPGTGDPGRVTEVAPGDNGPVTLLSPGADPPSTRFAPDPSEGRLTLTYNHTMYWHNGKSVRPDELGDLLTLTTRDAGTPAPNGHTTTLPAGKEVRAIKGADPARRIAVQTDQGWLAFDNILQPLPYNP